MCLRLPSSSCVQAHKEYTDRCDTFGLQPNQETAKKKEILMGKGRVTHSEYTLFEALVQSFTNKEGGVKKANQHLKTLDGAKIRTKMDDDEEEFVSDKLHKSLFGQVNALVSGGTLK